MHLQWGRWSTYAECILWSKRLKRGAEIWTVIQSLPYFIDNMCEAREKYMNFSRSKFHMMFDEISIYDVWTSHTIITRGDNFWNFRCPINAHAIRSHSKIWPEKNLSWWNSKFGFRILFLLPNPFEWCICLSKKVENWGMRMVSKFLQNFLQKLQFWKFSQFSFLES